MSPQLPDFITDTVHIETRLPLEWKALSAPQPDVSERADNLATLKLIEAMDEPVHAGGSDGEKHNEDLLRLEQKVDLVLQLLGQLLAQQSNPPRVSRHLVLGCHGMAWHDDQPLPANHTIRVKLYVHADVNPLVLMGESVPAGQDSKYNCVIRFVAQDDEFESHFEKWIFRQHRRAIARQRARAGSEN